MMKKLLVLLLVLGLASTASAVLVSSVQTYYFNMEISAPGEAFEIGDTVGVEIFAGTVDVSEMLETVLNISEAASISAITVSIPGDWAVDNPFVSTTAVGDGFNANVDGTLPSPISAGDSIYSFSFVANGAGVVTIDAVSGTWSGHTNTQVGPLDGFNDGTEGYEIYGLPYAEITVIPEPATIALLGLGGLFLRRRK